MKAVCWYGKNDVRVEKVPDPEILNPHDAIVKVELTAICGSDLHLYGCVHIPAMQPGDILGHEFMGEVVEVGKEVRLAQGGRPRGSALHHFVRRIVSSASSQAVVIM
jgi:threonine dehydrogenase-like Zn-dependent dehydrogenase